MNNLNVCRNELLIQSIIVFNKNIETNNDNNDISKSVKRLLSSLQSVSKRFSVNVSSSSLSSDQTFATELTKCLAILEKIVLFEDSFAETSVLSGLAIAFALNISLCDIKKAIHLYFKLFLKQSIISKDLSKYQIDNNLSDILANCQTDNHLSEISLLSGLLNCNYFIDYFIEFESKIFVQIHRHIIKICDKQLLHQFHVFKLLQHWFKSFKNYSKQLSAKESNLLDDRTVIVDTLKQIDNNWEHPINGVKDCIKVIYNLILETFTTFKNLVSNSDAKNCLFYDLISEEVFKTSRLALTSKAKYRKMSALIPLIGWKIILETDPKLSSQLFKYLSINSLSTAIIELYKALITSMKMDKNEDILMVWSKYFLNSMCCALKSKNKIIHNNLLAHLLPFTLINVENSTQLIFDNLKDSRLAEVAVVRAAVDHNLVIDFSPPFSWFKSILVNSEEMVREEGLTLLIDERYITDRDKVFKLLELFLLSNLNVDNPSFRQRIISKIEKFVLKVCISLSDKFVLYGVYDQLDQKSIEFLRQYTNIIVSNLISGSSFQRRTTCLLLFDSFLMITFKSNINLDKFLDLNQTYFLIVLSIVDKDDKIRKMATNLLIKYQNNYTNSLNSDFNEMAKIGLNFLNSPRHQESHSGGLIMKYLINCFQIFKIEDKNILNELELIEYFVRSAQNQFENSKNNLLVSAKTKPIHGFILALNNCISFDIFQNSEKNRLKNIINQSIDMCFDCTDLMLKQLSKSNIESSPSFQEMCESLETIISQQIDSKDNNFDDISTSNDFQLLLSMCWLNIKECSFLLSNLVELSQQFDHQIIGNTTILKIGYQLINVLSKCRHKGVIEATCIALTSFTVSLIKSKTHSTQHNHILNQLLTDSLKCITKSALTSSITRRSAGLALTIQAILTGESQAFILGFKLQKSLFNQTIDQLIETSNLELPQNIDIKSDLPQTYALHILQSIVSTASLSRFTIKIVEFLLPICIKGFSSDVWQIRNASLQLFGSCCCRMLGQRKISDVNHFMSEGSTITSNELFSRYPTLLQTFKIQFEKSFEKIENGFFSTELVPVLSLFASFSPICLGELYSDQQIISYLIRLLSNRIWKIRMLSAKALTSILPINQLEDLLFELSSQQNLNCNSIHGLMLSVNHFLELKQQNKDIDYQTIKDKFAKIFEKSINDNKNCFVLNNVFQEIFLDISQPIDFCGQQISDNQDFVDINKTNNYFKDFLDEIYLSVEFTKSDDIRLFASKSLAKSLKNILRDSDSFDILLKLVDILLVILEDEDRTVRTEAERIASKIIYSNDCQNIISYNICIDNLFIWLNENSRINSQKLTDYYFNKLESLSLSELIESQDINNEILFEKEEKNVFSEPLFLIFKITECLQKIIRKSGTKIDDKSLVKLADDCDYFLRHLSIVELKSMISFSIWKLPKLFICLNSLFLRTDILFHSLHCNPNETKISSINQSFKQLSLSEHNFEQYFSEDTVILNGLLTRDMMTKMCETHRLLSSKFGFLSVLKQKSLFGFSLLNFEI